MLTRRAFNMLLAGSVASAGLRPAFAGSTYKMPPESRWHVGCIMAFSAAHGLYTPAQIDGIRREQAAVAKAIAQFEPVIMLANADDMAMAQEYCGENVGVAEMAHFDVWTRDTLPTFVVDGDGQLAAVSWNFNVWGEKFPDFPGYDADRDLADRVAGLYGIPMVNAEIIAEGGAIEVDGAGTLLTTETCLMNDNRNPGKSREDVEAELMRLTGATKVIWLHGSQADQITDGHVDGIARFVYPGLAIAEVSDDPEDPEYEDLLTSAEQLEKATDARGAAIDVKRLMRPRWDVMPDRGNDFAASYVNCFVSNGGIVMPKFGDQERDDAARDLFATLHPGFEVVQVDVSQICEGGGGIHCNTQQVPAI